MHYIFICWFHYFIHQNKLMNFIDQNSSQSEWLKITTRKNAVFGHLFKFDNNLLSQGCTFFDIRFYYQILPFNYHCFHHIETSQLVYRANQLTGFYMMGTLVVKRLRCTAQKIKFPMNHFCRKWTRRNPYGKLHLLCRKYLHPNHICGITNENKVCWCS